MAVLIDTNILLAYAFARDGKHPQAVRLIQTLRDEQRIVPQTVLNELFYMVNVRMDYPKAIRVFAATRDAFQIQAPNNDDMVRMEAIMIQYTSAHFDFVDVSLMALAERLNITRICTLDHRDFSIFRPRHCDHFELLP